MALGTFVFKLSEFFLTFIKVDVFVIFLNILPPLFYVVVLCSTINRLVILLYKGFVLKT